MDDLASRLEDLGRRIAAAAATSGRPAEAVRVVAASKTVAAERVAAVVRAGLRDLGENRVQEAEAKIPAVAGILAQREGAPTTVAPTWHLIGHLQSNKAKRAAALFDWIQTVDSPRLAEALDRHAADLGRRLTVLVEVNVSGEPQKAGVAPDQAIALVTRVARLPHLAARGFMTVGPQVERPADARPAYRRLAGLLAEARRACPGAALDQLSMGMSGDFEVAIEEGATIVRPGEALFGARPVARPAPG